MKANELRIGNKVLFRGVEDIVWRVEDNNYVTENYGHGAYDKDLEPMPLTEEWLCRFGFKEVELSIPRKWNNKKFRIRETHPNRYFVSYKYGHVELIHVHQLQNLYFALTGEELKIKELND